MRDYEIRLRGQDSDDGEILFEDLDRIGAALKALIYRVTRAAASRAGLGRAPTEIERLSTVRVALAAGSTRLIFRVGDRGALEIDPLGLPVDAELWRIVQAMKSNIPPPDITDTVAEVVADLTAALPRAARQAAITVPGFGTCNVATDQLRPQVWTHVSSVPEAPSTVHGYLEMADLKTARLRIVDAVGNAIDLVDVRNPSEGRTLLGEQISAIGELTLGVGSKHHRMQHAFVSRRTPVPDRLGIASPDEGEQSLAHRGARPHPEPLDLSDAELDEFLAHLRG